MNQAINTSVAIIIFNRAATTTRVLKEIAKARPSRLFVIADGPRPNQPQDVEKCRAARDVVNAVDWKCEVLTNYSEQNLGLKRRIATGLDWVFSQVESAVVVEDDCVPHPDFFRFCDELLDRYRNDERVSMISGNNFLPLETQSSYSYFFTRYIGIWGWATWARSWKHFDLNMHQWPSLCNTSWLEDLLDDRAAAKFWRYTLESVARGYLNTWAYPWMFACWAQGGLSVTPCRNMVSNIGYGVDATNLKESDKAGDRLPVYEMEFPLRHPDTVMRRKEADDFLSRHIFRCYRWSNHGRFARIRRKLTEYIIPFNPMQSNTDISINHRQ